MSNVLRVAVSNVRIPRSQRITSVLPPARMYSADSSHSSMVAEMPRFLRCEYLDLDSLLAGRWREALDRLSTQPPPPERPRTDGAEVVVEMIVERLGE